MIVVTTESDFRPTLTTRLVLSTPMDTDMDELFDLHSDPRVWKHLPSGRHTDPVQTKELLDRYLKGWAENRLDVWVARDRETKTLVGMGGPSLRGGRVWNLYYRLAPAAWGLGYAQEIVAAARTATAELGSELPHVAVLLEHNEGSRRTAERAGFDQVWRGQDQGSPDTSAMRLIYADRPLSSDDLALFV
jgi:RimJ/RimL family protein N-acetyltransferase